MQVSQGVVWVFFAVVAIIMVAGWAYLFLRSEKLGSLDCTCYTKMGAGRTRLTIAREGDGASPTVQVRVRMTGSLVVHRLSVANARQLATLLDSAASRMRAP